MTNETAGGKLRWMQLPAGLAGWKRTQRKDRRGELYGEDYAVLVVRR